MNRRTRLITIVLLSLALSGIHQSLLAETPQFSVMELPAVEGSDGPQVAVKWSGELPASLQPGYEDEDGQFEPISPSVELTEAMTLLPNPTVDADLELSWRLLDHQGQILAKSRGDSVNAGWQPTFYGPGLDGSVHATTVYGGSLVVAGSFLTAGGEKVNRVARWDGSQWNSLTGPSGTGLEGGTVYALTVYNGEVIAGGRFNVAGGVAVNQIARWNGSEWASLDGPSGSGVAGGYEGVRALIVNNDVLMVGGHFTSAGGIATYGIASWNGSQWAKLDGPSDSGVNGRVYALEIYNDDLVVGGVFTSAGGLSADNIARWDGSQWAALHGSSGWGLSSQVHALAIYNGDLVAGGQFGYADGMPVNRIARWDGTDWFGFEGPSGMGVNATVNALAIYNGQLIAGGLFGTAGGVTVLRIARWNGSEWASLDGPSGTGISESVTVLTVFNSELIAGGGFSTAGGEVVNYISRWNSSEWAAFSGTPRGGVLSSVYAMTIYNGELIAAGYLRTAGGVTVNHIARWDGSEWASLEGTIGSGMNNTVLALTVYDGELIAGGYFTSAGGVPVNYIARWDGSEWASLSGPSATGVSFRVHALTVYNGELVAGGLFNSAGGVPVDRVARWDGDRWASLAGPSGTGVDGEVHALAVYNDELIVGGSFTYAGGLLANRIARWNGSEWGSLDGPSGVGMNSRVEALTVYNGELVAGGVFSDAGGVQANRVARWDGTQWTNLSGSTGSGVDNRIYALDVYDGRLIAGGDFSNAAGVTVNRIASWDGSEWGSLDGPLGIGMDNTVRALTVHSGDLFAGGVFSVAGGIASWRVGQYVSAYIVGGTVDGLAGIGLTIQNNGGDDLAITADGAFAFATALTSGSGYAVTVLSQPTAPDQICDVTNATGTVSGADVTDVAVNCTTLYTVGGTVSGLAGSGLVLQNNAGDDLAIGSNGSFVFDSALLDGTGYDVSVAVQPDDPSQTCTVANGSGTLAGADVTDVEVTCTTDQFTVGGTVTGLQGDQVVLQNNGADVQVITSDGGYVFSSQDDGTAYDVTVATQPGNPSQTCTVANGSGTLSGADVTDIEVTCSTDQFNVGGTVSGLAGSGLVLQNNGGDDLAIGSNGSFVFDTALLDGTGYDVTVAVQPGNPSQTCTVANGSGTLTGADVTDVEVTCVTDQFTVGGTVTGLEGDQVLLQNNGGDDQVITSDGGFVFSSQDDGTAYDVTVATQPGNPSQTCTVANGSGTLAGADVTDIEVTCTTDQFTVGGTVTGLEGDQVVLQNNGGDDQTLVADGGFTFSAQDDGTTYEVTVLAQPDDPSQTCTVANGSGTLTGADVTNVEVTCTTDQFTVGGAVTGLQGDQVVLQNNGGDDQTLVADGGFTFSPQDDGTTYEVTVLTQPDDPSQACTVANGSGTLAGADVTDVEVTCTTDTYTVTTTATNGTITSDIDPEIEHGQTTTVTGEADANHYFASVSGCDGTPQSNTDQSVEDFSYETGPITEACTVEAVFAVKTYDISAAVTQGEGTVNVLTPVVDHGDDAEFEVTPDTGWSLASFTGNPCTPTDNGDSTWTATMISADCDVTAEFIEDTTTDLDASMSPAIVDEPVTYTITVTGTASAPVDGQVELVSDLDGVICSLASADTTSGPTAVFSCQHTWNASGAHQLTATFSESDSHGDGEDILPQIIVSGEAVFSDRFEADP